MKNDCKEDTTEAIKEYRLYLEKLKTEFGHFLKMAEKSAWTNKGRVSLQTRKQSLKLREVLKEFRPISINQERELKKRYDKLNKEIMKEDL